MMRFVKKNSQLFIAGLLAIGIVALLYFGIRPMYQRMVNAREAIERFAAEREYQALQITRLPELQREYEKILKDEGRLDIFLTEPKIVGFIQRVEGLAAETNVRIEIAANETPLQEAKKKKSEDGEQDEKKEKTFADTLFHPEYVRLSLRVSGDYADIVNFLVRFEALPQTLDVIGLSVKPQISEEKDATPSSSDPNPFLLVPGQGTTSAEEQSAPAALTGPLRMDLDTVLYVDKP